MKALGEAAVDLPWILPCANSLVGLTRPDAAAVWSEVRYDPACVLLLARLEDASPITALQTPAALEKAWLTFLQRANAHVLRFDKRLKPFADVEMCQKIGCKTFQPRRILTGISKSGPWNGSTGKIDDIARTKRTKICCWNVL